MLRAVDTTSVNVEGYGDNLTTSVNVEGCGYNFSKC